MLTLALCAALGLGGALPRVVDSAPTAPGEIVRGDLGEALDGYLTLLESHGFSGAVAVADVEGLVLSKGYGLADRERGTEVTPDTVFTTGSITKQFTAAAILKLQEAGELSVDEALIDHFDDVPEGKQLITLHDLLTHGSGLDSDFAAGDFEPVDRTEYVRRALASELLFEPGTGFHYSNAGYSLLAAVIEQVTGMPYEQYLREALFLPAGMKDTGYLLPGYAPDQLAVGYRGGERMGTVIERLTADGPYWGLRGNGGVHSTTADMLRWHAALGTDAVLSAESRELLYTAHNPEPGGTAYGYGWSLEDTEDGKLVTHNGGNGVFGADFLRFIETGLVIYMSSNTAEMSAPELAHDVGRVARGLAVPMPPATLRLTADELAPFAGKFRTDEGDTIEVRVAPGGLQLVAETPRAFELITGDQPPPGSPDHKLAMRSVAVAEASAKGEFLPLAEALRMDPARIAKGQGELWDELRGSLGDFEQVGLVGAAPTDFGLSVLMRLEFESGRHFLRYVWEERSIGGLIFEEQAPARTVLPSSPTEFIEYDFQRGKSWSVRFELGPGGRASAAIFKTWRGDVRCASEPR